MKGAYVTMADMVNHPDHYNHGSRETIEEMRILFGNAAVEDFCRLSVYKYISRADYKGEKERDIKKADWYMTYIDNMHKERDARFIAHDDLWDKIHNVLTEISDTLRKQTERDAMLSDTLEFFKEMAFADINEALKDEIISSEEYKKRYDACMERYNTMVEKYIKKIGITNVSDIINEIINKGEINYGNECTE